MTVLKIFGRTRFETARGTATPWAGTRQRQLVELLAVHHPVPVSKSLLVEALWEGEPPVTAQRTLESHVCVVRRELSRVGLPRDLLVTEADGYRLSDRLVVDTATARRLLAPPLRGPGAWRRVLEAASVADQPMLASSPYAPWAAAARRDFDGLLASACTVAAEDALAAGQPREASVLAGRARALQPLSERSCRALVRAQAALGDRCQALRVFADFRQLVQDELGVEPSAETSQVYLEVLQDGLDARDDVRGVVSYDERRLLCLLLAQAGLPGQDRPAISLLGEGVHRPVRPRPRHSRLATRFSS